ncbi:hypothetical protein LY474_04010 [Myxococcus stipitatus]|uniref:hypothetical protein n=1 Tax=Myxococcus stipitatus TaxID=83455 RepID=UPI001F319F76|nr:hypothetical protein [Myxococcus stipitatus]MCE9666971.1 hypothetical protein [Myxococcus stipitatus]
MIIKDNVERLIRRGVHLGLIRLDDALPNASDGVFGGMLQSISDLLERLQHGATMRRLMYEYAEVCQAPLAKQIEGHRTSLAKAEDRPSPFDKKQLKGLEGLQSAYQGMQDVLRTGWDGNGADPAETLDRQQTAIHNPNILVDCGSGTEGELACQPGHVKVYQTVYGPSYGETEYKDVYQHIVHGKARLVIQPAGGKCNVSIGNPYRSLGWFFNYQTQGSRTALIRSWEIRESFFLKLLAAAGTEAQIKDMKEFYKAHKDLTNERFHVELCDHRATNQFGLWTHDESGNLTDFGKKFIDESSRLITYYDPNGTHVPQKRDGECRSIQRLIDHLGIPTDIKDRFHDLGTSVSDADGNLTMNEVAAQQDLKLLGLIHLLSDSTPAATSKIDGMDKERVRLFSNLILYNGLSPQRLNTATHFTSTGLVVKNLQSESAFMAEVHRTQSWHATLRKVVALMEENVKPGAKGAELEMTPDCQATVASLFPLCTTYRAALRAAKAMLGTGDVQKTNATFIEGLGLLLRFLCRDSGLFQQSFQAINTKSKEHGAENFRFGPFQDLRYEVGVAHRANTHGMTDGIDSLDGHDRPGFVATFGFSDKLSDSVLTSNNRFQTFQHSPVIARLHDAGLPVMGGISGTTRDIFRYFGDRLTHREFWEFFAVVAAFMIKNHYHSLAECFIAAFQFYDRGESSIGQFHYNKVFKKLDATKLYNVVSQRTGVYFE